MKVLIESGHTSVTDEHSRHFLLLLSAESSDLHRFDPSLDVDYLDTFLRLLASTTRINFA
jgi:hypothetical protein